MIMFKPFSATQSAADSNVETSMATNIQPGITLGAWSLIALEITFSPNLVKSWAAADADVTIQLTKRSISPVARLVSFADTDLLTSLNLAINAAGTPASLGIVTTTFFLELPPGIICYSETLYLQLISTATAVANVAWGRLLYEPVTLTQSEAFSIIASRP